MSITCTKCKGKGNFSIRGRCRTCGTPAPTKYNLAPLVDEPRSKKLRGPKPTQSKKF